jgi:hypothetical protein
LIEVVTMHCEKPQHLKKIEADCEAPTSHDDNASMSYNDEAAALAMRRQMMDLSTVS